MDGCMFSLFSYGSFIGFNSTAKVNHSYNVSVGRCVGNLCWNGELYLKFRSDAFGYFRYPWWKATIGQLSGSKYEDLIHEYEFLGK